MTDAIPNDKVTGGEATRPDLKDVDPLNPVVRFNGGIVNAVLRRYGDGSNRHYAEAVIEADERRLDTLRFAEEMGQVEITIRSLPLDTGHPENREPIDTPSPEPLPEGGAANGKDYGRASEVVTPADDSRVAVTFLAERMDHESDQHGSQLVLGGIQGDPNLAGLGEWDLGAAGPGGSVFNFMEPVEVTIRTATRANPDEGNATGTPDVGVAEVDKPNPDQANQLLRELEASASACLERAAVDPVWERDGVDAMVLADLERDAAAARNYLSEGSE
ncbi:MAG: hypothetical protein KGZ65_06110 [Sphingomonadales bacterium]|nr:hypothetical protein [Sphingomonadaceae bacterium]MBS3930793.1 hypothetical protein [Sphingomonadales bacterium]